MQLSLLAQTTIQTIERYYLAIALLIGAGSGEITQKQLEERCQLMAQRMTMLYGFNSPEFFDRALFENFIDLLRARGVVRVDAAGRLHVRRCADPGGRRRAAGAVGADPAQHSAGDARMTVHGVGGVRQSLCRRHADSDQVRCAPTRFLLQWHPA